MPQHALTRGTNHRPCPTAELRALGRLRSARERQSLAYLLTWPALAAWQWHYGFSPLSYALQLLISIGIGVIHHNHAHLPMWHGRWLNTARRTCGSSCCRAIRPGCSRPRTRPTTIAIGTAPRITRTYRFGGDRNDLIGWLVHPLNAMLAVHPLILQALAQLRRRQPVPGVLTGPYRRPNCSFSPRSGVESVKLAFATSKS